jgi:hypothetical protein
MTDINYTFSTDCTVRGKGRLQVVRYLVRNPSASS